MVPRAGNPAPRIHADEQGNSNWQLAQLKPAQAILPRSALARLIANCQLLFAFDLLSAVQSGLQNIDLKDSLGPICAHPRSSAVRI